MPKTQFTEMYDAIFDGDCEKIDSLIRSGLGVNAKTEGDQWNFLHMALVSLTETPDPLVIEHLLEIGVDANAQDRRLNTPLHYAVRANETAVVRPLIDTGVALDTPNDEGLTPLHLSLLESDLAVTEMLLAAGADPDFDVRGGSARKFAQAIRNPPRDEILKLMDKYRPAT